MVLMFCTMGTENFIRYIRLSAIIESDISELYCSLLRRKTDVEFGAGKQSCGCTTDDGADSGAVNTITDITMVEQ